MHAKNLAIIFSPNFLRSQEETADTMIGDANYAHALTVSLISRPEVYFIEQSTNRPVIARLAPAERTNLDLVFSFCDKTLNWLCVVLAAPPPHAATGGGSLSGALKNDILSSMTDAGAIKKASSRPAMPRDLFDVRHL
jgi:hypothetical protein